MFGKSYMISKFTSWKLTLGDIDTIARQCGNISQRERDRVHILHHSRFVVKMYDLDGSDVDSARFEGFYYEVGNVKHILSWSIISND